jgi:SAM-dependent methyltransferase
MTPNGSSHEQLPKPKWPKVLSPLSPEQERIRNDFVKHWLEVLPKRYGLFERFNHRYPLLSMKAQCRTLEIGAGLGAHLAFEDLAAQDYHVVELRPELVEQLRARFPMVKSVVGDCQETMDYPPAYFDRVLAIHVLEHLPNLPRALDEIDRVLRPGGLLSVVLPCEGGFAYSLARRISARRIFERRYKQSYDWFIANEHINRPHEILPELLAHFELRHRRFFPCAIPLVPLNLVFGMTLAKRG